MFENEPAWKQGDDCYIIWATLDCSNLEYVKKWNELSLCPIRREITEFSDRNLPVAEEEQGSVSRLLSSLYPLTEPHPFHYIQLKQFIQQGGKITSITRILKARQDAFMKEFCMTVQNLRRNARSDFEDKMYKLVLNALYGKTIMNELNFCQSKFITKPEELRKEMRDSNRLITLNPIT